MPLPHIDLYRAMRIALTQKLRRIIDEGSGYSLALEGISAADVARAAAQNERARSALRVSVR